MLDISTVLQLANAIDPRLRYLVLLGGFVGLRTGELLGLERQDVDLMHRVNHACRQAQEISGHRIVTEPKTEAGVRSLSRPGSLLRASRPTSLPAPLRVRPVPSLRDVQVCRYAAQICLGSGALAVAAVGLSGLRIHDLRHHSATTLARKRDVILRELMTAIGHTLQAAALCYQHATAERGLSLLTTTEFG